MLARRHPEAYGLANSTGPASHAILPSHTRTARNPGYFDGQLRLPIPLDGRRRDGLEVYSFLEKFSICLACGKGSNELPPEDKSFFYAPVAQSG